MPDLEGSYSGSAPQKSYSTVFRYKRDISKSSNIGAVLTNRESDGYYNRLGGIDGHIKFTKLDQIIFQVITRSLCL